MKKRLFIFIGLLASILGALPLYAQESCYAQYLREHNMRVLTAEDADDSYDELKKAVLAWQLYGSEASLPFAPKEEPAAPKQQDTTCVIVHLALVDSTWYMWLSVDPLADKYPNVTPYLYCNGNPVKFIDMCGDSVSFAQVELFDKKCGTNTLENIINDLQAITGLSLSVNNGMLEYAKNEDGSALLSSNGSSVSAREHLIALISNNQTINVGIGSKSRTLGNNISLAPKQINCFIYGARGVDGRTLGFGMTFLHESFHTNIGGALKDDINARGSVVDKMNVIRLELNNVGYNFGQRMLYCAITSHGSNYIPFNSFALQALDAGLLPCSLFGQQYIRF